MFIKSVRLFANPLITQLFIHPIGKVVILSNLSSDQSIQVLYTSLGFPVIFFLLKTTLDNCDGHIARVTNQVSLKGGILDDYGAHINSLGFWAGLGFYLAHVSDLTIFYYFRRNR